MKSDAQLFDDSGAPRNSETSNVEVSVVMPCLNEADTLAVCIAKAQLALQRSGISGEILVADSAALMTPSASPKS